MSHTEHSRFLVSLLGFSDTERIMLSSMFRLSAKRLPSYVLNDDPFLADIIVINAEDKDAITDLEQLSAERTIPSVWIGGDESGGGSARVPRPIVWSAVFKALDGIVERGRNQDVLLDPSRPRTIPLGDWITTPDSIAAMANFTQPSTPESNDTSIPVAPWALIVTQDIQLRQFLAKYLAASGFNAEEIDDVRMAIAMNAARDYFCVFVEADMDTMDGFSLCRLLHVKRKDWPRVILVLAEDNSLLRLRAYWSGAYTTLSKPLTRDAMRQTVNRLRQEVVSAKPK